jgi:hypothetical protein
LDQKHFEPNNDQQTTTNNQEKTKKESEEMSLFNANLYAEHADKLTERKSKEDVLQPLEDNGHCKILGKLDTKIDYNLRFLPPYDQMSFFIPVKAHYFTRGKSYICPEMFGSTCPACERGWEYFEKGKKSDEQHPLFRELAKQEPFYWPCLWTNGTMQKRIHLLRAPITLHAGGLWKGTIRGQQTVGSVTNELTEYVRELIADNNVPEEMKKDGPHPLYFLLSAKYGRLIRVTRQGEGMGTTYAARVLKIDNPYELGEDVISENKDWMGVIRSVIWDNFDHDAFVHSIEDNIEAIQKPSGTTSYFPAEDTRTEKAAPTTVSNYYEPDINIMNKPTETEFPFDMNEPSHVVKPEVKPEPEAKKAPTPTPAPAPEAKADAPETTTKRHMIDHLALTKLPVTVGDMKRSEFLTKFLTEHQDVAKSYAEMYDGIEKTDVTSRNEVLKSYVDEIKATA